MHDAPTNARRLAAFAIDWLIFVLWAGMLFGAVMLATGGDPPRPGGPWRAQAIGLLLATLPFTLYFTLCEGSQWRASLGKRILGLCVVRSTGEPLSHTRAFVRNAVKFVPWECGHMLAQQAFASGDEGFPAWVWGPAAVSMIVPLWWLGAMWFMGQTPYDRWTDTRVVRVSVRQPR